MMILYIYLIGIPVSSFLIGMMNARVSASSQVPVAASIVWPFLMVVVVLEVLAHLGNKL